MFFAISCNEIVLKPVPLTNNQDQIAGLKSMTMRIYRPHPRIILTDSVLNSLKMHALTDPLLHRYVDEVIYQADNTYLKLPILQYVLSGSDGLLATSKNALECMLNLSLAYRWTNDQKYALKAKSQLIAICNFTNWNPVHFLDTGTMSSAVAIGYDWLYNWLDQPTRALIENALLNKGINAYLTEYAKNKWWLSSNTNWNMTCNGGVLIGALSIANIYREESEVIIQKTVENLPVGIASFGPDGAWLEGTNYWKTAANQTAFCIEALKTSIGTDFGLSNIVGLSNAGNFPMYTIGPNSYPLNYDDTRTILLKDAYPRPSLLWLGKQFNNPDFINLEHRFLQNTPAEIRDVMFYSQPQEAMDNRKLDKYFDGEVPVAVFRSEWDNNQSLFVGVKGGSNGIYQGHLDLGSFELEALGIRWAYDLGADNYDLPGYFNNEVGGKRWSYYRLNSHSHNVPMINNKDQLVTGEAIVIAHLENVAEPFIRFDLTSAYTNDADLVTREIKIIKNRKAVQITEKLFLKTQADVYWGMTTPASIQILANGKAILTKDGKTLYATIVSPLGANFYAESAEQVAPQALNTGFSRLMVKVKFSPGGYTLRISLSMLP